MNALYSGVGRALVLQRLMDKASPEPNTGCYLWLGAVTKDGYGKIGLGPVGITPKHVVYAHRLAWELDNGPIAARLTIDHLCRQRCCVNPKHMEAVTQQQNCARRAPMDASGEKASARMRRAWVTRRLNMQSARAAAEVSS